MFSKKKIINICSLICALVVVTFCFAPVRDSYALISAKSPSCVNNFSAQGTTQTTEESTTQPSESTTESTSQSTTQNETTSTEKESTADNDTDLVTATTKNVKKNKSKRSPPTGNGSVYPLAALVSLAFTSAIFFAYILITKKSKNKGV